MQMTGNAQDKVETCLEIVLQTQKMHLKLVYT